MSTEINLREEIQGEGRVVLTLNPSGTLSLTVVNDDEGTASCIEMSDGQLVAICELLNKGIDIHGM